MSKPKIVRFDFGSSLGLSDSQKNSKKEKDPDILILVDAFWILEKKGKMKIGFIPHQMIVELYVILKLKHDDETHDRNKAKFHLSFDIPGTRYEGEKKEIVIEYKDIKDYSFHQLGLENTYKDKNHEYYYYTIKNFTSDLTTVSINEEEQ